MKNLFKRIGYLLYLLFDLGIDEMDRTIKRHHMLTVFGVLVFIEGIYVVDAVFLPPHSDWEGREKTIAVHRGMNVYTIAEKLYDDEIITSKNWFIYSARLLRYDKHLKAGKFKISQGVSIYHLLKTFKDSPPTVEQITIPEGTRAAHIAGLLQNKIEIDSTRFVKLIHDTSFIHQVLLPKMFSVSSKEFDPKKEYSLEGYLYPSTYDFFWGMDEKQIITRLVNEFWKVYNDTLMNRTREMGWTVHDAVTLASIIEGEAIFNSERRTISSVYHNRLWKKMRLGADPTIQYIIPNGPRRLLLSDLDIESPYNTYKYRGLPPGPVNNPGRSSLVAALWPNRSDYLYFVARGDGYHTFTRTAEAHMQAKKQFDQVRRKINRTKKHSAERSSVNHK